MSLDPEIVRLGDLYGFLPNPAPMTCNASVWTDNVMRSHGVVVAAGAGLVRGADRYCTACAHRAVRQEHADELDQGRQIDVEFGGGGDD